MSDSCPPSPDTYPSDCELMEGYRTLARERASRQKSAQRQLALARAREIKLLLLDVDGVLTDGTLTYGSSTEESKSFHTQDGFGLRLLREAGISAGLITARKSELVQRRAAELKMNYIYQGISNKLNALDEIIKKSGLKPFEIAYMGDDWLDLPILQRIGFAVAPANAVVEVREAVHYITEHTGGRGAVRDCCNIILEAQNRIPDLLQKYKLK